MRICVCLCERACACVLCVMCLCGVVWCVCLLFVCFVYVCAYVFVRCISGVWGDAVWCVVRVVLCLRVLLFDVFVCVFRLWSFVRCCISCFCCVLFDCMWSLK